jgi:uncharacterized protein YbjT (DUF2867 family)
MYAVCGATGNIGNRIVLTLLENNEDVRAIGRSGEKLQALADRGAQPVVADLTDTDALTRTFSGAEAVFVLIPPNPIAPDIRDYQNRVGESIARAIKTAGVSWVVNLSSIGAHQSDGVGVVNGLHDQEERLNNLGDSINVLNLRPSFFMENHLMQVRTIREKGAMASPLKADQPVPQIATADIAAFAADRLRNKDFEGKAVRELLGPEDLTPRQSAHILGEAIGKSGLKYDETPYGATRDYLVEAGLSKSVANGMVELYRAFNEGHARPTESRSADNTTPTTLKDFSRSFEQLYKQQ